VSKQTPACLTSGCEAQICLLHVKLHLSKKSEGKQGSYFPHKNSLISIKLVFACYKPEHGPVTMLILSCEEILLLLLGGERTSECPGQVRKALMMSLEMDPTNWGNVLKGWFTLKLILVCCSLPQSASKM